MSWIYVMEQIYSHTYIFWYLLLDYVWSVETYDFSDQNMNQGIPSL